MKIFISYGYRPYTTAVYLERALKKFHDVTYIGPQYGERLGYMSNVDVSNICKELGQPDLFIFVEPGINFFPKGIENLNCPTACYLIDVHSDIRIRENYAPFFDHIFIAQKDYVGHFLDIGYKQVYWLPLACDSELHGRRMVDQKYEVGFVGKIFGGGQSRESILKEVGSRYSTNQLYRTYPKESIAEIYSASKIVVNVPVGGDLNMRVFEAIASGSLLITQDIQNGQKELFEDGVHIVEYHSREDLFNKIDYYLVNEVERERIARAGCELALRLHTYDLRMNQLVNLTTGKDGLACAPARTMSSKQLHSAYAEIYGMMGLIDPILDEIRSAKRNGTLSKKIWAIFFISLLRKLNAIFHFTPGAKRALKVRK